MKLIKQLIILATVMTLAGCGIIPSASDPGQNARAVDLVIAARTLDCSAQVESQAQMMRADAVWIRTSGEFGGLRSRDVVAMVHPIVDTLDGLIEFGDNQFFCEITQEQLITQTEAVAGALLRRMK